jgi:hypothetical protein
MGFSAFVILAADDRENWIHAPAALLMGEDLFVPKEHEHSTTKVTWNRWQRRKFLHKPEIRNMVSNGSKS